MRRTLPLVGLATVAVLALSACGGTSTPDVAAEPAAGAAPAQGIAAGEPNPAAPSPPPTSATFPTGPRPSEPPAASEQPTCSASDLAVAMVEPTGVPDAVARTYDRIRAAALACDYGALASIGGDTLTVSFGAVDDPAAFWKQLESEGATPPPMATLVRLLGGTHATDANGTVVWPAVQVDPDDETFLAAAR